MQAGTDAVDHRHPGVAVVISTLDRPALLERCLTALAHGEHRPDRVVVVDQGSPSPTAAVIARARDAGLAVEHVVQDRRGLSASQNAGVRRAGSDVVAVVDDDCVPDRRWVAVVAEAFGSSPGPLLLTGRILAMPVDGARTRAVSTRTSEHPRQWTSPPPPWEVGSGGNFAVTRAAFLAVGGNDERLGTGAPGRGANDLDLFWRLIEAGVLARYEPDLVVHHERSTAQEHRSRRSSYGFGVGAMVGLRARRGAPGAARVLGQWLALRSRVARERRHQGGLADEVRVLGGTAAGLLHGWRAAAQADA